MPSFFLPTAGALEYIAEGLALQPNDPAVTAAFDQLVISGQVQPWGEGWWELTSEAMPRRSR